jgi:ElaB/YqjD/DUF883 family membrane-anchored ribosome-binding protein
MAQPLPRTPDISTVDTNAIPAPAARTLPPATAMEIRLTETAESIGGSLGSAVRRVRDLQELLEKQFILIQERARSISERAGATVMELRDAADARVTELKDAADAKVTELKDAADAKVVELKDAADRQIRRARAQADHVSREYPLHLIAGVAATAFLAGVSLRIWRSGRV